MLRVIFEFLSNLFGFGKAVSEEVTQRDAEKNTAEMKANATAAVREDIRGQATDAVAKNDVKAIEDQLADT